jgi:2-polyprenyl-6-methoxyphenol hydroxylase-like FAD-dependent oxidoreductase
MQVIEDPTTIETTCCIVGGGPAGMMLGWLLARAGIDVVVLEKHADFFRDFRGDTIHPSTLELLAELGVLHEFLAVRHTRVESLELQILGEHVPGPDFSRVPTSCKFIALMPQWDFLDFVRRRASALPDFHLRMETEADGLVRDGERVVGVTARSQGRSLVIRAGLVVGTDGRHSTIRGAAGLVHRDLGAPIDVLWMRLSRRPSDGDQVLGIINADTCLVMLDRGSYWQCAYLIGKGQLDAIQQRGLPAFRAGLRQVVPALGDRADELRSWDDIALLTVTVDRLERWAAPGVLCIGDAAHAMSPVGGVGINLAIQDAVATANLLWRPLARGDAGLDDLLAVQGRRERPTRETQALQLAIHDHVLAQILAGHAVLRLRIVRFVLRHFAFLRTRMASALGVGFGPEHIESPDRSRAVRVSQQSARPYSEG